MARQTRQRQLAELAEAARALGGSPWEDVAARADALREREGDPTPRELTALRASMPSTEHWAGNAKALDYGRLTPTEADLARLASLERAKKAGLALVTRL